MGKKGGGSVAAPDPYKTAAAQGAANKDAAIATAQMNMIDTYGPYGSSVYQNLGTDPVTKVPRYSQTTTLDPSQQRQLQSSNQLSENALNTGLGLWQNITDATKDRFKISGQPPLPSDYSADRNKIVDDLYGGAMQRLEPQFTRDRDSLENKLVNQGLTRGSEAFTNASRDQEFAINDARNQALQSAIQTGGNEQSRLFGLNMAGRQQGIQEQSLERSQPINEVSTLLGLGGSVTPPQFQSPSQVSIQPGDVSGNVWNSYNAQVAQQNAQRQAAQQSFGNALGLAGSIAAAPMTGGGSVAGKLFGSDRSIKKKIKKIGKWFNGLNIYSFEYLTSDKKHVGFMADEVEKIHPNAVHIIFGKKFVDYSEAIK